MKKWAYLLVFCFVATLMFAGYKTFLVITHPTKFRQEIREISTEYDLPAQVVASIVNIESSYKTNAKSNKNALGLMQIKLSTAEYLKNLYNLETEVDEQALFNAETNLKFGCLYLKYLLNKFEDLPTALAAYNAGETRVRTWLSDKTFSVDGKTLTIIPYAETANYIKKFYKNLKFYSKVYKN